MSKKQKILRVFLGILLSLGVLAICAVGFFYANHFYMEIRLLGDNGIHTEYGEAYTDAGAEAWLVGNILFRDGYPLQQTQILTSCVPDTGSLGKQNVTYESEYFIWKASAQRTVFVVDTQCPEIELLPDSGEPVLAGTVYEEPGYKATDNYDGDLTQQVIRLEKEGMITYAVIDSSGNPAYATREIPYFDPAPPVITLEGESEITIGVGTWFEDPGFTASDNVDGDMTEQVTVEGEVDWLTPGTYELHYTATDTYENKTTVIRTVHVTGAEWPDTEWPNRKTIYLTFDDGPGPYTMELLDILDRYGAKATFFVVGTGYGNVMRQIVARGHSIGIHSVTHNYQQIYADPRAYFEDLYQMQQIIYDHTGVRTTLLRFPGGGSNLVSRNTCEGIMSTLTWAVRDAGFQYFDWNVDSDDAGSARKSETVRDNVIKGIQETGTGMVLMHDIHRYTVDAVADILAWGYDNGYRFQAIKPSTPGFHHDVLN